MNGIVTNHSHYGCALKSVLDLNVGKMQMCGLWICRYSNV